MQLTFSSFEEIQGFGLDKWGIPTLDRVEERKRGEEDPDLSLVLLPGVAFDSGCQRLGHGKGYYDSFLARMPHPVDMIGLALDEQIVDEVPLEGTDVGLHSVVTPTRVFHA